SGHQADAAAARGGAAHPRPSLARGVGRHHPGDRSRDRRDRSRRTLRRRADPLRPRAGRRTGGIPIATVTTPDITALHDEVRELAETRNAVILAHNYQVPEVQDVADYVGDSPGPPSPAAATHSDT